MSTDVTKTPAEWASYLDVVILDPDGWDRSDFAVDWARPLTEAEFRLKAALSTTNMRGAR